MSIEVKSGFWRDESRSGWAASTWTVKVDAGSIIISALATFIALVGSRCWMIVSFILHQSRASDVAKDGMYHQHQLIYRNGVSQLSTIWEMLCISWAWRKRISQNPLRTALGILPPLICFALFAVAGIFSARVAAPSYSASRVLIKPRNCGFINFNSSVERITDLALIKEARSALSKHATGIALQARNYARACYTEQRDSAGACSTYAVQRLPYIISYNVPCPFAKKRCILGENTALRLSTPWLNSHHHFGINAAPEDRLEIRRSATCSVLDIKNLTRIEYKLDSTDAIYYYYLGPLKTPDFDLVYTDWVADMMQNLNLGYVLR